ncbi:hypothetical protein CH375_14645, partial [Leptospira ellisii]
MPFTDRKRNRPRIVFLPDDKYKNGKTSGSNIIHPDMIRALEYCMENPSTVLERVPDDFETIKTELLNRKRKDIARYFGFDPESLHALERISEKALIAGHHVSFRTLYSFSDYRKVFRHLPSLNVFLFEFLLCAYRKGWNGKWDMPLLSDIASRFPDENRGETEPVTVFSIYDELKRRTPERKISSLEALYRAEKERVARISEKGFTGTDQSYPPPPAESRGWMIPIETRRELFLESVSQHNCVFDYDVDIMEGKYYIYRIYLPERCTLSLFQINGDWYMDQVAGAFNREVGFET